MFKYENQLNWNNQYTLYNTKESNFSSKEVLGMAISNRLTGYLVTKSVISYLWNWKSSAVNNISLFFPENVNCVQAYEQNFQNKRTRYWFHLVIDNINENVCINNSFIQGYQNTIGWKQPCSTSFEKVDNLNKNNH